MTDDIVDRLRDILMEPSDFLDALGSEAANEIERLRSDGVRMRDAMKKFVKSSQEANEKIDEQWSQEQDKLRLRIEVLEKELKDKHNSVTD